MRREATPTSEEKQNPASEEIEFRIRGQKHFETRVILRDGRGREYLQGEQDDPKGLIRIPRPILIERDGEGRAFIER